LEGLGGSGSETRGHATDKQKEILEEGWSLVEDICYFIAACKSVFKLVNIYVPYRNKTTFMSVLIEISVQYTSHNAYNARTAFSALFFHCQKAKQICSQNTETKRRRPGSSFRNLPKIQHAHLSRKDTMPS